jgi:DNA-binding transcriptional regulator LsrR (DeoR family)
MNYTVRYTDVVRQKNFERVKRWYKTHLGCTQKECSEALKLSPQAVCRHVKELREQWADERMGHDDI